MILAAGLATAALLLADLWPNFQGWQATRGNDPSAAELYFDNCLVDGGMAIGALGLAGVLFYFLGLDVGDGSGERPR